MLQQIQSRPIIKPSTPLRDEIALAFSITKLEQRKPKSPNRSSRLEGYSTVTDAHQMELKDKRLSGPA